MYHTSNGYFKKVQCPDEKRAGSCDTLNCIFGHKSGPFEPARKRRHIQVAETAHEKPAQTPSKAENISKSSEAGKPIAVQDPAHILPKEVTPAPAQMSTRKHYIKVMRDIILKVDPEEETPIIKATAIEFEVASTSKTSTYVQLIKRKAYELGHPEKFKTKSTDWTDQELLQALEKLVIPLEKLERFGYITRAPKPAIPSSNRVCRRCSIEFKLDDQLDIGRCLYHEGKIMKKDKSTRIYTCCGAEVSPDTDPCASAEHHVFSWSSPGEMHFFLPFKSTKLLFPTNPKACKAVGIDCEMGFTTQGFELLRITAIDFLTGEEVIDILVRPFGEVVDLNTKFSGIAQISEDAEEFQAAIARLGSVIDHETILIGHGLENDLNAMRFLHSRVVDTAILYPKHKATPKFRYSLKQLCFEFLGRTIQTGEHDSSEDSLAAIDIVKHFIKKDGKS